MCAARHRPPAYAEHVSRRTFGWVLVGVQAFCSSPRPAPPPVPVHGERGRGVRARRRGDRAGMVSVPRPRSRTDPDTRADPRRRPANGRAVPLRAAPDLLRDPAGGHSLRRGVGTWWTVAALGVLGLFFLAKSRWEDRLLRAQYGAAWEEWASTTGALLPAPSLSGDSWSSDVRCVPPRLAAQQREEGRLFEVGVRVDAVEQPLHDLPRAARRAR